MLYIYVYIKNKHVPYLQFFLGKTSQKEILCSLTLTPFPTFIQEAFIELLLYAKLQKQMI